MGIIADAAVIVQEQRGDPGGGAGGGCGHVPGAAIRGQPREGDVPQPEAAGARARHHVLQPRRRMPDVRPETRRRNLPFLLPRLQGIHVHLTFLVHDFLTFLCIH